MSWSHSSPTGLGQMVCVPATPERLPDLDLVMGERGTARRCYCMYWRRPDGGFEDDRDNRDRFAEVLDAARPPGLIGYVDGDSVGWVQVAPRGDFPTTWRSPLVKPEDEDHPWVVNCFVVRAGHRKQGIASGLLAAALAWAEGHGAQMVEAYPVDGDRTSAVDLYTGTLRMFEAQGFEVVRRPKASRPIVRLRLD
jgi:GNAT superfamily N-acetyltransferase